MENTAFISENDFLKARKKISENKGKKIIFFGSRSHGKPGKWSDIDLVIVSSKFRRLNFFKRGAKMYDYWKLNYPVDFLCYTPEEFNKLKKQITIVKEAVENGIEIK